MIRKEKFLRNIILTNILFRKIALIGIDGVLIFCSIIFTNYFINNSLFDLDFLYYKVFFFLLIGILVLLFSGQYKAISKYIGGTLFYLTAIRNLFLIFLVLIFGIFNYKLIFGFKFLILNWFFLTALISGSRLILRDFLIRLSLFKKKSPRVLIYGAGNAGAQLASSIIISGKYQIIGFIDDSPYLDGRELCGIRISRFEKIKNFSNINHVLIAIPSLEKKSRRKIINSLKALKLDVLQVPSLNDITTGKVKIDKLKPVELEDLLGRESVLPDKALLGPGIKDSVVCVTGAGGSIGSELCRQIVKLKAKRILLVDNCEHNLYLIYQELILNFQKKENIYPILGDVTNEQFVDKFVTQHKVDLIFHAAAYKHVPMVENNPVAGIFNNVLSTYTLCLVAKNRNIKQFILISTDKAVRPKNVMGASKRLSELIVQAFANDQKKYFSENQTFIKFSMVRFGNVLGSSGSVIPVFKNQIKKGGPITLTHKDITRYFMTIKEAAELVLQSVPLANGGDVFLLDMGEPVKIMFLAEQLIRLSGLTIKDKNNPKGDIEIICTGLRSGEKLFEELLIDAKSEETKHPLIFKANESSLKYSELIPKLDVLKVFLYQEKKSDCLQLLSELVPEWK